MGCRKLTYYETLSPLKVVCNDLIINENCYVGGYRYGFNGMERDDNVKGAGNSYDFGARLYDPRVGRWLSCDPLEAKYSSLSPYNFVNNMPIIAIDPDGKDIIVLSAPTGARGRGHAAVLIGNDTDGWTFFSKNGTATNGSYGASHKPDTGKETFATLSDFANSSHNVVNGEAYYTNGYKITTSPDVDDKMKTAAKETAMKPYDLFKSSCIDLCSDALKAGGLDPGTADKDQTYGLLKVKTLDGLKDEPNERFKDIKANNTGSDVSDKIKISDEVKQLAKSANQETTDIVDLGLKYNTNDSDNTRVSNIQSVVNMEKVVLKENAKQKLQGVRDQSKSRPK